MGSEIKGRIVFIRKDGHVNISLRPQKESAMGTDAEALLKKLTENGGELFITDSSDPQEIKDMLGISKSAFKRAVGNLLKKKLIDLGEKSIRLVK
jgi:predicted RNA-binding protein (virulence factor B family)